MFFFKRLLIFCLKKKHQKKALFVGQKICKCLLGAVLFDHVIVSASQAELNETKELLSGRG